MDAIIIAASCFHNLLPCVVPAALEVWLISVVIVCCLRPQVGRFVPAGGTGRGLGFGGGETREQALQRGLSNIQSVADRLRLSPQHVASAHRLYLMASQRNFSVGRRGSVVAGACLYAICRRERTPHLLIDFSDVLRVSVRSLGQVPHVDPSLFLDRFAAQLQLGEKTQQIAQTAVRLVQAMRRDWITTGRRPMGLCGAALLIAARYHDVQIDAEEVATAVRVSCPTLSKRLYEFKKTAKEKPLCPWEMDLQQVLQGILFLSLIPTSDAASPVEKAASELPATAGDPRPSPEAPSAADQTSGGGGYDSHTGIIPLASQRVEGMRVSREKDALDVCWLVASCLVLTLAACKAFSSCVSYGDFASHDLEPAHLQTAECEYAERGDREEEETIRAADSVNPLADLLRSVRFAETFYRSDSSSSRRESCLCAPLEMMPLQARVDELLPTSEVSRITADGERRGAAVEDEDAGDSDDGLDDMLLTEQEREAKALIWDDLTRDIMPEVHRRLRQRKQKEREQQHNPSKRRRPQARRTAALAAAASAAESVRLSLEKRGKGLAQRIDEEALEALFAARRVVEL
ncbi:transcription factor iiib [Cyclospora cayetanensis]|uniref:Transcription factor iiib n=1 Tax=Cyclospora cayetanensis TaxID=88456 RepID=A0A1D3D6V8_9EIME|nr:transcription factor iiib [Cyclospora cayetanensis]